jgi:hypothetical protein
MVRNTDLIEETVQLANTVADLLRKIACVHHLVQVVNAVGGEGAGDGRITMLYTSKEKNNTSLWTNAQRKKNVCRVYFDKAWA